MTKSTITREQLEEWLAQFDEDGGCDATDRQLEDLIRQSLAAMDSEPVIIVGDDGGDALAYRRLIQTFPPGTKLYRHAQPASVGNEFIPKNLDRALGVLGMALPESKEEFNLQSERWIQRLIDRVIRYADEFLEQPTPVVPEEWTITHAVKFCKETGRQDAGTAMDAWNACRAAMLASSTHSHGSETATVPGKWIPVSERMPEMGEHQCYVLAADFKNHYWPNIPNTQVGVYGDWFGDGNPAWDDGDGEDMHLKEVTHWMPLPAAPQEVK